MSKPLVIADSGVWIDYFNGQFTPHTDFLDTQIVEGNVALFDVILMEVLQGFRQPKSYQVAKTLLNSLDCYAILGKNNAILYADYYRKLRQKGITIRKSNDVMIAGFCIENTLALLFTDKDFLPFVTYLDLTPALKFH